MWQAQTRQSGSVTQYQFLQGGASLTFREYFSLLENNPDFADWYSNILASSKYSACFWEHPPLTEHTIKSPAEFVLVDSPALATVEADPLPFRQQFVNQPDQTVITFRNLGGDALLVTPRPIHMDDDYPHLAAFVRHAPRQQIQALWRSTASAVLEQVCDVPFWLSTAGLGVYWLHIRLDSRPKYYSYAPYRTWPD